VFNNPSLASAGFVDLSGSFALCALDSLGRVYSQNYAAFSIMNVAQNLAGQGAYVAAIYSRLVAFATVLPARISLSVPSKLNSVDIPTANVVATSHFDLFVTLMPWHPLSDHDMLPSAFFSSTQNGISSLAPARITRFRRDGTGLGLRALSSSTAVNIGSLSQALALYSLPGTYITLNSGTYTDTNISSSANYLTLIGTPPVTIKCTGGPGHCLRLTGNYVLFQGITVTSAGTGEAYIVPLGMTHTFRNVSFLNCAGTAVDVFGSLSVQSSFFTGNQGGGLACASTSGYVTITSSVFANNYATEGAGVYSQDCFITISNTAFVKNKAGNKGGGISMLRGSGAFSSITLLGNEASSGGGMSLAQAVATVNVVNFTLNTASSTGAAICMSF
jgi:hypothetical protein